MTSPAAPEEEQLAGGVANAGAVTRAGEHVLRPSNPHTPTIHGFLRQLRAVGFTGASEPVGVDPDGRERLVFIAGEVPITPFPAWAQTDDALASIAELLRGLHDAAQLMGTTSGSWSTEMADPEGGPIVCHNDVCLENVVFRDGRAVGLLDFDFAAPGRPTYDLAQMVRMCGPIDDDVSAAASGWEPNDAPARLRLAADAYGLDEPGRAELLDVLSGTIARGGEFVRRRVEAGDQPFVEMWRAIGGMERFDRRRRWFAAERERFVEAMR